MTSSGRAAMMVALDNITSGRAVGRSLATGAAPPTDSKNLSSGRAGRSVDGFASKMRDRPFSPAPRRRQVRSCARSIPMKATCKELATETSISGILSNRNEIPPLAPTVCQLCAFFRAGDVLCPGKQGNLLRAVRAHGSFAFPSATIRAPVEVHYNCCHDRAGSISGIGLVQ
jgi:hypothetical protein